MSCFAQVTIRQAQAEDIASVAELLSQTFYQQQGWRSLFTPLLKMGLYYDLASKFQAATQHYQCLLAELPNLTQPQQMLVVGTIEIGQRSLNTPTLFSPPIPYIANLAVAPSYRQQGIGQALIQACEAIVERWNQQDIYLHVRTDNAAALALYKKNGFQPAAKPTYSSQRQLLHKPMTCSAPLIPGD